MVVCSIHGLVTWISTGDGACGNIANLKQPDRCYAHLMSGMTN